MSNFWTYFIFIVWTKIFRKLHNYHGHVDVACIQLFSYLVVDAVDARSCKVLASVRQRVVFITRDNWSGI